MSAIKKIPVVLLSVAAVVSCVVSAGAVTVFAVPFSEAASAANDSGSAAPAFAAVVAPVVTGAVAPAVSGAAPVSAAAVKVQEQEEATSPTTSVAEVAAASLVRAADVPGGTAKDVRDSLWQSANDAYMDANYVEAIDRYEQITSVGWESPELYLNLGNAYFKRGMNGKAILNYNRALKMKPSFADAKYNLSVAAAQVQDKIDEIPVFFVKNWLRAVHRSLSGNTWAVLSIVLLALVLGSALLYLLGERLSLQKTGFFAGLFFLLCMMASVHFASMSRKMERRPGEAVIMRSAVSVKSSPGASSTELFILHEGTKVKVYGTIGEYREISIADGNRGWLPVSSFELID